MNLAYLKSTLLEGSYLPRAIRRLGSWLNRASSNHLMRKALYKAGVPHADRIFSHTQPNELQALYQLALGCPEYANALEIGSHLGASACYLAAGLAQKQGRLFCVDTWNNETMPDGEKDTFPQFEANTRGVSAHITPLRKWSTEVRGEELRLPLHLVFIDGDHSYQAVKTDFELVEPWLAEEAIVAFHDTAAFAGVSRCLGEVLANDVFRIGGHIQNLSWLRKRVAETAASA